MFNAFVRTETTKLQKDTLSSYLQFLNPATWPYPLSSEWEAFGLDLGVVQGVVQVLFGCSQVE